MTHSKMRLVSQSSFVAALSLVALSIFAQAPLSYAILIQQGRAQLQTGSTEQAAASGKAAIKMSTERWEGYALVGGAFMNLKRYEEAADTLSKAIERAPESKQPGLRELRRQCLLAESGSPTVPSTPAPATTTSQAEIVLWKSIESSTNAADFQSYLEQYPQGAFAVLAHRHLAEANDIVEQQKARQLAILHGDDLPGSIWKGVQSYDDHEMDDFILVILLEDGSAIDFRQWLKDKKAMQRVNADRESLSRDSFLSKYASTKMSATWAMTDGLLTIDRDENGCHEILTGQRSVSGTALNGSMVWRGRRTGDRFDCRGQGNWRLQRIFQ